jgi:hypothetical protein
MRLSPRESAEGMSRPQSHGSAATTVVSATGIAGSMTAGVTHVLPSWVAALLTVVTGVPTLMCGLAHAVERAAAARQAWTAALADRRLLEVEAELASRLRDRSLTAQAHAIAVTQLRAVRQLRPRSFL